MDLDALRALIGAKIIEAMSLEGLNVKDLAERMNISTAMIYRYRSGENVPLESLNQIATICHQPLLWFFTVSATMEGQVSEEDGPWYTNPKRQELVKKVKHFVQTADDKAVNALLENVEQFQEKSDVIRELEKLKSGQRKNS